MRKIIVASVIVILIVVAAILGYHFHKERAAQTMPSAHMSTTAQEQPNWIDVDPAKSGFPPYMITGAPVSAKGNVVSDRYFIDSQRMLHGEYAFTVTLTPQHGRDDFYSAYLDVIKNDKKVSILSQTPDLIRIAQSGYSDASIVLTDPNAQTIEVDITYTYKLPSQK